MIEQYTGLKKYGDEAKSQQRKVLESGDYENCLPIKSKIMKKSSSNFGLIKGKQNECHNLYTQNTKNVVTGHSFNGFFNQVTQKMKKKVNESISRKIESSKTLQESSQPNSLISNFNSSGKLSNFQFINQSSEIFPDNIHDEMKSFMKKYFPDCQQLDKITDQYISIQDFVDILFDEFENLIGKQTSVDLIQEFTDKVFLTFGEKIYFHQLFEKTVQTGLTGLIFEIVKAIDEDKSIQWDDMQDRSVTKTHNPVLKQTVTVSPKNLTGSNVSLIKSQRNSSMIKVNDVYPQNSRMNHSKNVEKISLNKFFGNSSSKVQLSQDSRSFFDDASIYQDENLQDVKRILSEYVESMYEEAQLKLNKKYSQQLRKITQKYKETEKLLEKLNEKISSHYDTLELQKEYDRKVKEMNEKQTDVQNKLKKVEFQLKQAKDQAQKQRLNFSKLDQQFVKMKEKLEKYENAIFQKAMEKGSTQNSINASSVVKEQPSTHSSIYSHQNLQHFGEKITQNPRFEVKIDTFTEHRPSIAPLTHSPSYSSYSPYLSRQTDNTLTPTRIRQTRVSVSPIKQRISFVKTQNPGLNMKVTSQNSRISYSPMLNKQSEMQKTGNQVQVGERISLRPLSPIGKLGETHVGGVNNMSVNSRIMTGDNNISQVKYVSNNQPYQSFTPANVQFCTSQVGTLNVPMR